MAEKSELVRWTADQVGKTSRSATEQAPRVPVAVPHRQPLGYWPIEGSKEKVGSPPQGVAARRPVRLAAAPPGEDATLLQSDV